MFPQPKTDLSGLQAISKMLAKPLMTLSFYPFGIVRRRETDNGIEETLLSAEQLAKAFANHKEQWQSGILTPDLLYIARRNLTTISVSYRAAQRTGLYIDNQPDALRIPMPHLVLFKFHTDGRQPSYKLYAMKQRPKTGDEPLYTPPVPNIYQNGDICWGNVSKPKLQSFNMESDWAAIFGSPFGNHAIGNKSNLHPADIRQMWQHVHDKKMKRYPLNDLIPADKTFNDVLEGHRV